MLHTSGYFAEYAETLETGESSVALSNAAKENKVHLMVVLNKKMENCTAHLHYILIKDYR